VALLSIVALLSVVALLSIVALPPVVALLSTVALLSFVACPLGVNADLYVELVQINLGAAIIPFTSSFPVALPYLIFVVSPISGSDKLCDNKLELFWLLKAKCRIDDLCLLDLLLW
jgi:hypothetical protein